MYARTLGKNKQFAKSNKDSGRTAIVDQAPTIMMQLQRMIGNRAVTQLFHQKFQNDTSLAMGTSQSQNTEPVVQRASIGGKRIRPYGRDGVSLWENTKQALYINGLSPYGAKKVFYDVVKSDSQFENEDHFVNEFVTMAKREVNRVVKEKKTLPKEQWTKGWTRPLKLNRPAWTDDHKVTTKQGEDIRHIVRNATMKNALLREYQHWMAIDHSGGKAFEVFQFLAQSIGIEVETAHAWELLKSVYDAVFLNAGNLFPGPGGVNRVIGLTADDIERFGMELLIDGTVISADQIEQIFDRVAYMIADKSDQTERSAEKLHRKGKLSDEGKETFLKGLEDFFDNITDYLIDAEEEFMDRAEKGPVLVSEVGRVIMEIGANFGFDIPLDSMNLDPGQMKELIIVEQFLAQYNGGDPNNLAETLKSFMKLKKILFEH